MGRKRIEAQVDTFEELDEIYRDNDYDNNLVNALNALPVDERALMIRYIAANCNKLALSKELGCGRTLIHNKITKIQVKLKKLIVYD